MFNIYLNIKGELISGVERKYKRPYVPLRAKKLGEE